MHITQRYRRGILLPLNAESECELRRFECTPSTRATFLSIDDDCLYENLWRIGIFQSINKQTGALIDDYEEEIVESGSMEEVIIAIEKTGKLGGELTPQVAQFLQALRSIAEESARIRMPLLFVL